MATFLCCVLVALVAFLIGRFVGWVSAHSAIADECRKVGAFYVGNWIFKVGEIVPPEPRETGYRPRPRADDCLTKPVPPRFVSTAPGDE
jgi:hypothetical protein